MEAVNDNPKVLLEKLEQDALSTLISPRAVSERLMAIGEASFAQRLCLRIKFAQEEFLWGDTSDITQLQAIDDGTLAPGVVYEFLGKNLPQRKADRELISLFEGLAKALWGNDIRKHGAIAFDRDVVKDQICESLAALASDGNGHLAVVFIDLDHFKALNSHLGEAEADKVIQQVNRRFHDMTREFGGLAFNRSGDEFFVFLPFEGLLPVLQALHSMRATVKAQEYAGSSGAKVSVDMTMGVTLTLHYSTYDAVVTITSAAEGHTKHNGVKRRGRITIAGSAAEPSEDCTPLQILKLGAALVRRRLNGVPFGNAYLNFVSHTVASVRQENQLTLDTTVQEVLAWFGLMISDQSGESALLTLTNSETVPRLAVALSIAHGLARFDTAAEPNGGCDKAISITYSEDGSRASVFRGETLAWGTSLEGDTKFEVLAALLPDVRPYCLVGVQFGLSEDPRTDSKQPMPLDIFDQIVLVDERPISGGNLPDFWQPAIAEVFSTLGAQDAEPHVIVWGAGAEKSETYKQLSGNGSWRTDEVSNVAKLSSGAVEALKEGIKASLKLVGPGDSLVAAVFSIISPAPRRARKNSEPHAAATQHGALTRPMLSPNSLPLEDGLRCGNAAQAYPILIDVLRKGKKVRFSTDDAKGNLKELLAFKLILEDPLHNDVPAYLADQKDELDAYAKRAVLDKENGLFRRLLESTGQIEAFVQHLVGYLGAPEPARSTRRACLVVPNAVENGELKPLGLLSVWASPRVGSDRHLVDFVFVWRTVEAFVGLPYSLFGSIRLAENLIKEVATKMPIVPNGRAPGVGELTYIPMSLHMRVDEFHARIAKRIVDESSD